MGVDFYVGVQFPLGAPGYWKAGEGDSEGAHGSGTTPKSLGSPPGPRALADSRYLGQQAEVPVQNGAVGPLEEIQEAVRREVESVGCGQLRQEFLLLRLVVQDFRFWAAEGKKSGSFRRLHVPYSPS